MKTKGQKSQAEITPISTSPSSFEIGEGLAFLDKLVTAIWVYDIENYCILWANQAGLTLWESESLDELTRRDFRPGASDAVQQTLIDYQQLFKSGKTVSRLWRYSPKGVLKEVYSQMSGYPLKDGRMALLTEAIGTELVDKNSGTSSVITLSTYTLDGELISGNPPFLESQSADYSHLASLFVYPEDYAKVRNLLENTGRFEGDVQIYAHQESLWHRLLISICPHDNLEDSLLVQQFNIDQRKRKEIALEKEVITDPLTGLLNRRGLKKLVIDKTSFVLFYIDLDGFKLVNDSLGHATGDQLLQYLSAKLTNGFFERGIACRCGGDEFIWLAEQAKLEESQEQIANTLIKAMSEPFFDEEHRPINVSASIGIARYPQDDHDLNQLIIKADAAMYEAKKQGKHRWVEYVSGMEYTLQRHGKLAQHLYKAQENREFQLYYQPIIDTDTKTVCSFEALLRWQNATLGNVPTDQCLQVAEEMGILLDIEKWVLATAIRDINTFRVLFGDHISIAVNVSAQYFSDIEFLPFVLSELARHHLSCSSLHIEITETTLINDITQGKRTANQLKQNAIPISIDDFGTGYSSLSYIGQIPATYIKIDRSFTEQINRDTGLIKSIHHLIESLHFKTIVEGVETTKQSDMLSALGMPIQQGYGLGLPQPLSYYQKPDNVIALKQQGAERANDDT